MTQRPEWDVRKEEDREQFIEQLEEMDHIESVRPYGSGIDFRIGAFEIWPDSFDDDQLRVISSSSIATMTAAVSDYKEFKFVSEANIHLPPAPEELKPDIKDALDVGENLHVYFGTGALGGIPAPDGVITPHIRSSDSVTYDTVMDAVFQAQTAYITIYDGGENAITEKP